MPDQSTRKPTGPKPRPVAERFWEKVDKNGPIPAHRPELGPCWIWNGSMYHDGYGMFGVRVEGKQKFHRAHRFAYEMVNGPIPDGLFLLHRCDTPACVNPAHHFTGTQADNMKDKVTKGRQSRGDDHYTRATVHFDRGFERWSTHATLTGDQVREIRRRYADGGVLQKELAAEFGVTKQAISRVIRRDRWPHIE